MAETNDLRVKLFTLQRKPQQVAWCPTTGRHYSCQILAARSIRALGAARRDEGRLEALTASRSPATQPATRAGQARATPGDAGGGWREGYAPLLESLSRAKSRIGSRENCGIPAQWAVALQWRDGLTQRWRGDLKTAASEIAKKVGGSVLKMKWDPKIFLVD